MIKSRDARRLTVDELRSLVNVANNQNETFATGPTEGGMDAQGILDLHHAAADNGDWDGIQAFWENEPEKAHAAWTRVQREVRARAEEEKG